jgi:hypothetical protein
MIYKGFLTATYEAVTDIFPGLAGDPKRQGGVFPIGGIGKVGAKKRGGMVISCDRVCGILS